MSNYATKSNLKNATEIGTSKLAEKSGWASLTPEVHKLDIYKLKIVPANLSDLKKSR